MKGIIFNELQKMVTVSLGADAWEALLEQTPLETEGGGFIGPQTYPDKDLFALVGTASRVTGKPVDELVRSFGKFLFPDLARLYPGFLKPGMTAKSFLTTVHDVIHVEVRKLHPDVELPRFRYEDPAPNQLVMLYDSPRQLCELAIGLVEGVADHFHETIALVQTQCTKRGDPVCRLELTFGAAG
ncbi:MAG: hypothetical protein USCGTAYLOR_02565 [Chromatiales bacterium USCg_Taylor]|nr:MAG: hypothetical protein USCGTAYLOR_02565 [Chromatiales bacterium USCg_Taylor]